MKLDSCPHALNLNDILDNHLSRGNSGNRGVNYSEGLHMLSFVCHLREKIHVLEEDTETIIN